MVDKYIMPQSHSAEETKHIGKEIAATLNRGDIITFEGELGTGKTTLIKGIAEYFGIHDVVSPTFTLMQVYEKTNQDSLSLVHVDTYRLHNEQELIGIGIEDYLGSPNSICLIEWPEKLQHLLERYQVKKIVLQHDSNNARTILQE